MVYFIIITADGNYSIRIVSSVVYFIIITSAGNYSIRRVSSVVYFIIITAAGNYSIRSGKFHNKANVSSEIGLSLSLRYHEIIASFVR